MSTILLKKELFRAKSHVLFAIIAHFGRCDLPDQKSGQNKAEKVSYKKFTGFS